MSFDDRIQAAHAAVSGHNAAVGGHGKPGYLDPDEFISLVKASGGTTEDRLSALTHEDILACMPPGPQGVKPRVLARDIANLFRKAKTDEKSAESDRRPVSERKADKMTVRELVENYDPRDPSNPVARRLTALGKGQKFVVFGDGGVVNVEVTLKLLNEVIAGYPGRDFYDADKTVKPVYRVGEGVGNTADENPLYRNRPLRPDGTCDQTGRSWEGVPLELRQLVRVAVETGELVVTHESAHNTLDIVVDPSGFHKFSVRYRKSTVAFEALRAEGKLPPLKIKLGAAPAGKPPFPDGKQVVWALNPAANAYVLRENPGWPTVKPR